VEPQYQLVVERRDNLDYLEVQVEVSDAIFSDEIKNLERREKQMEKELHEALLIHAKVKLVEPKAQSRAARARQRESSTRESSRVSHDGLDQRHWNSNL